MHTTDLTSTSLKWSECILKILNMYVLMTDTKTIYTVKCKWSHVNDCVLNACSFLSLYYYRIFFAIARETESTTICVMKTNKTISYYHFHHTHFMSCHRHNLYENHAHNHHIVFSTNLRMYSNVQQYLYWSLYWDFKKSTDQVVSS